MSSKKVIGDRITRDEINEALKRYLTKGGTIKRIEVQNGANSLFGDSYDLNEGFTTDDISYRDLGIQAPSL